MSKRSRGNDYAPSTFPFLAVLLCVIGALILLLVINVTNSRASARKQVQGELSEAIEEAKEQSDYLVSISEELRARREQVKNQIESRRRELARTEDHIKRLQGQLDESMARLESLHELTADHSESIDSQSQIEQLKSKLDQERKNLAEKLQDRKDQTPAFSIIPYEGTNRTTRRPVYLECTEHGVVIQPEGILVSMEDLGPPHGPGNPLDAALRVLRNAYQARDAVYGITIPPYPLLIVRPEGIHSYALARSAMAGWDDQFGYELIDEQMQLAYPEGIPELKEELTRSLAIAKDRQRALVAALPARFSRNPFATKSENSWDSIDAESMAGSGNSKSETNPNMKRSERDVANDGRRWEMIQQLPSNSVVASQAPSRDGDPTLLPSLPKTGSSDGFKTSVPPRQASSQDAPQLSDLNSLADSAGSSTWSGNSSEASSTSGATGGPTQGDALDGSSIPSNSASNSTASRFSSSPSGASGGSASSSQNSEDTQMEQALREQAMKQQDGSTPSVNKSVPSRTASQKSNGSDSELKPISLTAGKDWATSRMDNKSTPVSRPIGIIVLQDRWLMCKEGQNWKYDAEILLEQGPQVASEQLQRSIRDRVDSWGLSLPGGYWAPSLTVQAAADADQSVQRLQKLLEGSGVLIKVEPLTTPTPRK
jgi:hypothetical protein